MNDYFGLLISIKTDDSSRYFGHYHTTTNTHIWLTEFTNDDHVCIPVDDIFDISVLGTEDILSLLDCSLAVALALKEMNK